MSLFGFFGKLRLLKGNLSILYLINTAYNKIQGIKGEINMYHLFLFIKF